MRLNGFLLAAAALAVPFGALAPAMGQSSPPPAAGLNPAGVAPVPAAGPAGGAAPTGAPASSDDLLGNMVVMAGAGRSLPVIAVAPSLASELEDVTLRSVVRRDLDLSGEFELLDDSRAPESAWDSYKPDSPIDRKAWSA